MRGPVLRKKSIPEASGRQVEAVAETLENYARRGVFRGFSQGPLRNGKIAFRMVWHLDRAFDLIFDSNRGTMRFPSVLPDVPAASRMYLDLKEFIKSRHSAELPEHRRIDSRKARIGCHVRSGNVSITLRVSNGDYVYGARKLINLVHEIFLVFLADRYYDYMVDAFDLNPDRM